MMKAINLFTCAILLYVSCTAQNPQDILSGTFNKCQKIKSGQYEMLRTMKYLTSNDTLKFRYSCTFKKLTDDSLYSSAFHYKVFWDNEIGSEVLYTGKEFAIAFAKDSVGTIKDKSKWANEIKMTRNNSVLYTPFTSKESKPLKHGEDFFDTTLSFTYIGKEEFKGKECERVRIVERPENNDAEEMKSLSIEIEFLISDKDSIPLMFDRHIVACMNQDTMHQYERFEITKLEINNVQNDSDLTLASLAGYYRLKDYTPYKPAPTLPNDTIAPDWELKSLTGESISLKSLRGKLVLIDFFYKSCYPCMLALPSLQKLNEKYGKDGLRIIGIDPYDDDAEDLSRFLKKRGVDYTVLIGVVKIAEAYRVRGYPTMYLIDRTGKIIHSQVGFGKGSEDDLENVIKKYLNR